MQEKIDALQKKSITCGCRRSHDKSFLNYVYCWFNYTWYFSCKFNHSIIDPNHHLLSSICSLLVKCNLNHTPPPPSPSKFHLSGTAAVRRPVFSRLSVQLVCRCGLGSRPAGQPYPEGAAAEGSTGHQPGKAPCVLAAAVHQHPLPGRTLTTAVSCWNDRDAMPTGYVCRGRKDCVWTEAYLWQITVITEVSRKKMEQCHIVVILQGDKIIRRVSIVFVLCLCVCFECLGGTCAGYFGLASVVGVVLAHVLGDLAFL